MRVPKILKAAGNVVDKVFTSKEEILSVQYKRVQLQTKINELEAKHRTLFVSGWRPFIGWVCGVALLWNFLLREWLIWGVSLLDRLEFVPPPALDLGQLMPVLLGMLGLGAYRSYEKVKGKVR